MLGNGVWKSCRELKSKVCTTIFLAAFEANLKKDKFVFWHIIVHNYNNVDKLGRRESPRNSGPKTCLENSSLYKEPPLKSGLSKFHARPFEELYA
jgi:hypothetical protein